MTTIKFHFKSKFTFFLILFSVLSGVAVLLYQELSKINATVNEEQYTYETRDKLLRSEFRDKHRYFAGDFVDNEVVSSDGFGYTKIRSKITNISEKDQGWIIHTTSKVGGRELKLDFLLEKEQKYITWFEFVTENDLEEKYTDSSASEILSKLQTDYTVVIQITTRIPIHFRSKQCDTYCEKILSDFNNKLDNKTFQKDFSEGNKTDFMLGLITSVGRI